MLIPLIHVPNVDTMIDRCSAVVEFSYTHAEWIFMGCLFLLFSDYYPPIRVRVVQILHWMVQLAVIVSTWKLVHFMYMLTTDIHQCI